MVAAVAYKAKHMAPKKNTTGPATSLAASFPYKKIKPPRKKQMKARLKA